MKCFSEKAGLTAYCLALSLFTVAAYHAPFFKAAVANVEGGFNGAVLVLSAALLLLGLDFLLYTLLVYAGRFVGKCILAFTLVGNAIMLYCVTTYDALVTDSMMGNVIRTQYSEVSGFFSWSGVLFVLAMGVVPCIYVFARKVDYGSWKRFLRNIGITLAVLLAVVFGNMKNWPWIDNNSTELGSLIAPWSYIVNSVRFLQSEKKANVQETLLPDVTAVSDSRDVCVFIIGESARRDHFSLLGYGKETNPYTAQDTVAARNAVAAATNTMGGVKALLEPYPSGELMEILPNYLQRAGVDVIWRTNNWGEPPVKTEKYYKKTDLCKRFPGADSRYDGVLFEGLKEEILSSGARKVFVVVHTYTNHGPSYNTNYPAEFERFTPVCNTVEMSKTSREELLNAYDNSIVYADYLVHSTIRTLREIPGRRACVLFVSDHGESLGENSLYMHGVPMAMAPREQIEIPFVVWTSDHSLQVKEMDPVTQYSVYHTVLRFLGIQSPVYDANLDIFE